MNNTHLRKSCNAIAPDFCDCNKIGFKLEYAVFASKKTLVFRFAAF